MLNSFVEGNEWIVANGEDKCIGKWTRIVGNSRTVVDYILMDQALWNGVDKVVVDEMGHLEVGSDHCWIWLDLSDKINKTLGGKRRMKWNIQSSANWDVYRAKLESTIMADINGPRNDKSAEEEGKRLMGCIIEAAEQTVGKKPILPWEKRERE